jgi:hypothetical protein
MAMNCKGIYGAYIVSIILYILAAAWIADDLIIKGI